MWHVHALIVGVPTSLKAATAAWKARNGRVDCSRPRSTARVSRYVTKSINGAKNAFDTDDIVVADTLARYVVKRNGSPSEGGAVLTSADVSGRLRRVDVRGGSGEGRGRE
jgi:hypothetical protein